MKKALLACFVVASALVVFDAPPGSCGVTLGCKNCAIPEQPGCKNCAVEELYSCKNCVTIELPGCKNC